MDEEQKKQIAELENCGKYNKKQLEVLVKAVLNHIPLNALHNPAFNDRQMTQIFLGELHGYNTSVYAKECFNEYQMAQIYAALSNLLPADKIKVIANPEFNEFQMAQVRVGFEVGIDANRYADSSLSWQEMRKEYEKLVKEKRTLDNQIRHAESKMCTGERSYSVCFSMERL